MNKHSKDTRLLLKDVILGTVFLYLIYFLLAIVPINLKVFHSIKLALKDFKFTDIYYSKLHKNEKQQPTGEIVLVNIGRANRAQISQTIEAVSSGNPKVLGLDVYFSSRNDAHADSLLKQAISKAESITRVVHAGFLGQEEEQWVYKKSNDAFFTSQTPSYINLMQAESKPTIRYFEPFKKSGGQELESFSVAVVKAFDAEKYEVLKKRHKKKEYIHYVGNEEKFNVLDYRMLDSTFDVRAAFENKIVLLGFLGDTLNMPYDIEDKFFTPLNDKYVGRSNPDMYGLVIHANIIEMVLRERYLNAPPSWLVWLFSLVFVILHVWAFVYFYVKQHIWFHLVAKILQLITAGLIVYISLYLHETWRIILDTSLFTLPVVLSVDVLYFYDGLVKFLHKKWGFSTYFMYGHH